MPAHKLPEHKKAKRVSMAFYPQDIENIRAAAALLDTSLSQAVAVAVRELLEDRRGTDDATCHR